MTADAEAPGEELVDVSEPDRGPSLVGTVIAERYRVDAELGVGGMGAVYRGEHVLMRKPVAIKVLHRELTILDEVVRRFEREAIAAGRIDHPNVATATDFGKLPGGAFYLVLEYVAGRSLARALEEDGRFPPERALGVARQIARALSAAHGAGIVHRDLKPDNVMLIERGGTRDFVKVLDFGIAKISADGPGGGGQLTRLGAVFGTPAYMAPEQAAGQPVDARADLYSLGHVLYEMLAGHAAFESDDVVALLTKQLTQPPPPLPGEVPDEVRALTLRLLEKDPGARPQTADDVVVAIDALLGSDEPAPASRVPFGPTSQRERAEPVAPALAPGPVVAADGDGEGSVVARVPVAAVTLTAPEASRPRGSWLSRLPGDQVALGPIRAPIWLLGAGVGAVLMIGVGLATLGGGAPRAADPDPALLARAAAGEEAALGELTRLPNAARTPRHWAAIAAGQARGGRAAEALAAAREAVRADPDLARDPGVLLSVRSAADDAAVAPAALELAAASLGEAGADLLFDVWASTAEKTDRTILAKKLLDRDDVRERASRALRLALELRRQRPCEEMRALVEEAVEHGDERSLRPLGQLAAKSGCGLLGLGDCYPCLRRDTRLADALRAAQGRP